MSRTRSQARRRSIDSAGLEKRVLGIDEPNIGRNTTVGHGMTKYTLNMFDTDSSYITTALDLRGIRGARPQNQKVVKYVVPHKSDILARFPLEAPDLRVFLKKCLPDTVRSLKKHIY